MVLRVGGMRFIGCVGALMAQSGLVDNMSCAFRGVDHNVERKKLYAYFPCIEVLVETVI